MLLWTAFLLCLSTNYLHLLTESWCLKVSQVFHKHSLSSEAVGLYFNSLFSEWVTIWCLFFPSFPFHCHCCGVFFPPTASVFQASALQFGPNLFFLCSHITKVMGGLVKNIFALRDFDFCCDFSCTDTGLFIQDVGGGGIVEGVSVDVFAGSWGRKWKAIQKNNNPPQKTNDFGGEWFRLSSIHWMTRQMLGWA